MESIDNPDSIGDLQSKEAYVYQLDFIDNLQDVQAFIPELVCEVCQNILKNPLECKSCEKSICTECKIKLFSKCPN